MMTIIECGALYALTLVILLATYETHSNGAYVVTDIVRPLDPCFESAQTTNSIAWLGDWSSYTDHILPRHHARSDDPYAQERRTAHHYDGAALCGALGLDELDLVAL